MSDSLRSSYDWTQPPLFEDHDVPQPVCRPCGDTGTVPQARNGQPMICPWCDPSREHH